jgi:hypothetical protein
MLRRDILRMSIALFCFLASAMTVTAFARQDTTVLKDSPTNSVVSQAVAFPGNTTVDSVSSQPSQRPLKWYSMISNLPGDWKEYYTLKFQMNKIPEFVGLGVLTAGLIVTDDKTYEVSDRWYKNSQTVSDVSNFFVSLGDGKSQFALGGAFAVYGLLKDDNRALRTGSQIVQAVLASGAVVQVLKHLTGRESPFVRTSARGTWRFFPNQIDYLKHVPAYDAFPSGHICTALATVIVIAENYPETAWIRPVGYIVSGLVGVGMVNRGIHWYSDYPLGLAIGYAFGMIAAHPEAILSANPANENAPHLSIAPAVNGNGVGLSMAIVF